MYNKIGDKIKKERESAGLSQKELAEKAGYNNYQTLLKIEKGDRNITIGDLGRISEALNLNMNYFLFEEEQKEYHVLWRECKDIKACKIYENRLKTYTDNYFHLRKLLDLHIDNFIPENVNDFIERYSDFLTDRYKLASELAVDFRRSFNLGDYPADTLMNAIADKGILVFSFSSMEDAGSAASYVTPNGASILLNSKESPWRRFFDIGHELYHILTWNLLDYTMHDYKLRDSDAEEHFANAFSANLLMPKSSIRKEIDSLSSIDQINESFIWRMAVKFKVSVDALMNRLEFLQIIDEKKKEAIKATCVKKDFWREYNKKNSKECCQKSKDEYDESYFTLVYSAWMSERITKMKMAEYLNKNIGEIDYYLKQRGLAYE
jgi:Zn-dependent peptidase ImmA (M78 family)/transcriptional regulator with XRE-family HTH domain